MPENKENRLKQLNIYSRDRHNLRQIITSLSIVVILVVFWSLKLTGIGIAGEAFCGKQEHTHADTCIQKTLICTLEEAESHTHTEACLHRELTCPTQEPTFETGTETTETTESATETHHVHDDTCWTVAAGFGCGQFEKDGHIHTAQCLTDKTQLDCGKEVSEGHTHTDACYEIVSSCQIEEHTHIESCYSDITADLETSDDWEMTLADMVRGPTTRENVVLVAQSQLGYTESVLNFQVDAQGVRRGITRYGQWYGNPYGDWSAMFVSFCLEYAGATDLPMNAGPESMRLEWEAAGLYRSAGEALPVIGDLIFLRKDSETTKANAVAIITQVSEQMLTVIQGDLNSTVAEATYALTDPALLGYGVIPDRGAYNLMADPPSGTVPLAQNTNYSASLISDNNQFVFYTENGGNTYAIDGNGNAVQVYIGNDGQIFTDLADPNMLLWSISSYNNNSWAIQNVSTGRYLHPFYNSGSDNGIITPGRWGTTISASGTGVKFSHSAYVGLELANGRFRMVRNQNQNVTFQVGITQRCTIWLDGTDGGLGHLTGSPDVSYSVQVGQTLQLPTEWTSPSKYSYKLRGWYDITNARYYLPGEEMTVTGNTVLYADWVASTYDIGQFNAQVADTVSTNGFITTHMFDYNYLFNLHSTRVQATVNASDHSETWSMVTSGNVAHGDSETFNFIFVDNDSGGLLCMPNNRSDHNVYPGEGIVTPDIYSAELGQLLFATNNSFDPATGTGVLGKTYLGTGDHLFQIMDDPTDEHYGYYYYDSRRNAASYNQSNSRFYVYEYLAATSDAIGSTYSDFLPLNSPYANTNGKSVGSYNYDGVDGEYRGVPHYRYDSKYNSGNYNAVGNVQTDYAYGMRTDITFYLPNEPGSGGNKDLFGNDMQFQFSGDDDLWVLIDGQLVLDIGGIHGAEEGTIDFSTGQVTVQGRQQTSLMDLGITKGDHTLSILYLERGSSLSNCSIYFNLAPRFSLQLQKEDVLTQEVLNGTQFTVYEDFACTKPAELWESEAAYNHDLADGVLDEFQSTFTVQKGVAKLWGLGSGNTYYIKETGPPAAEGYGLASGLIRLTIEKGGLNTYRVDVIADAEGNEPSNGFTVHGVRIDEETKTVYIVATNAPETVTETTTVQVLKKWEDTKSHSEDYITAYLTVTDPDGTVRRIREIILSDENDWMYIWTNLPKYDYDALTEVKYGITESYESGYYSTVRRITEIQITQTKWAEALSFQNGETYILRTANGYLSTRNNNSDTGFKWVDEETAKSSPNALWTTTVNSGKVKFTNGVGQTITFYYGGGSPTDFYARIGSPGSNDRQEFSVSSRAGGLQIFYQQGRNNYYLANSMNNSQKFNYSTNANSSLILIPMEKITTSTSMEVGDWAYQITNTPLPAANETSFAVRKEWEIPAGSSSTLYQEFAVTVRLFANGVNTGRTLTLTLKNNWQGAFQGLPYKDDNGNVIAYTVEEVWNQPMWTSQYGPIEVIDGSPPTYSTVITNSYYEGGPELPSTGSAARMMYVLCGFGIMLGTLVYGIGSRRKRERRFE